MYPLTGEFRSDGRMENFLRMPNQVVMFGIEQKLSRRYKRAISVKEDVLFDSFSSLSYFLLLND